jgi:hypothetical protein
MKQKKRAHYVPPAVKVTRVGLESGIAVQVSTTILLQDWEPGGEVGANPATEGGDIYLF